MKKIIFIILLFISNFIKCTDFDSKPDEQNTPDKKHIQLNDSYEIISPKSRAKEALRKLKQWLKNKNKKNKR